MPSLFKKNKYLKLFKLLHQEGQYKGPLIVRIYGMLNKLNFVKENRYILCNFIDQNSDIFNLKEDIYFSNNTQTLNQLFLLAYNKAKKFELLDVLYEDYMNSIEAILNKRDTSL